jgi:hypothetical protein
MNDRCSPGSVDLRTELARAISNPNRTTGPITISKQLDAIMAIFERELGSRAAAATPSEPIETAPLPARMRDFIRSGITQFKEHELREIVAAFCKLSGIAPQPANVAQPTWQPIETAPRDGTRILATGGGIGDEAIEIVNYNVRVAAWDVPDGTLDDRDDEAEGYNRPTLWQPLPALSITSTQRECKFPNCDCPGSAMAPDCAVTSPHQPGGK